MSKPPFLTKQATSNSWQANRNDWLAILVDIVGQRYVLHRPEELAVYECDACLLIKMRPDAVVLPRTTEEVAQIVTCCNTFNLPYIARGSGTGLSGGALPAEGGLIISLNRMNTIHRIDPEAQTAWVEVGVINGHLNERLDREDIPLFFAPDPSSQSASTIGGNIAENAGGIHCLKYGVTTDHILALEVVFPDGTVNWVGQSVRYHGGYNLTQLIVGSEGTLGIVTQAIVRLTPKPNSIRTYLAAFADFKQAGQSVSAIIASGLIPAALEYMDAFTVNAVNQAFNVGFPEGSEAVLLIELDGSDEPSVLTDEAVLTQNLTAHHATEIRTAETALERKTLWAARKGAVAAYGRYLPAFYLHDTVIPRSQLTPVLEQINAIAKKYDITVGNVFHAGDGNLHPNILFDPDDTAMINRITEGGEAILNACLAVGGTLSGEHGIGLEKAEYMSRIFSSEDLATMVAIKATFDPKRLANPAKIFPQRSGCGETKHAMTAGALAQITPNSPDNGVWI